MGQPNFRRSCARSWKIFSNIYSFGVLLPIFSFHRHGLVRDFCYPDTLPVVLVFVNFQADEFTGGNIPALFFVDFLNKFFVYVVDAEADQF